MVVFLAFFLLFSLGAIGVVALLLVGQLPAEPANLATIAVCLVAYGLFGWKILRDSRLVRIIDITDDNTWILKSVFGIVRARIAPTQARSFAVKEQVRWILTGTARRMKVSWAEIEVDRRVWKTCMNPPASQAEAITLIRAWIRDRPG